MRHRTTRSILALALLAAPLLARAEVVQVGVGEQELIRTDSRITRVAMGDPEIAGANVLSVREVMLTGKKRGDTSLTVWTRGADEPTRYAIVVASGDLPDVLIADTRAALKTQVQTDIRIAEVSRSALRQIGFNFIHNPVSGRVGGVTTPGSSNGLEFGTRQNPTGNEPFSTVTPQSSTGFQPIGDAFNLLLSDSDQDTAGLLSILERRGLMRTLAQPSLVAMSGQTATFLAGGEFPIPVTQGGGGGSATSITIEFKEFGIRLALTPTVLQEDRIVLKVAPEVSELDFDSGVTLQGITVPGVRVRRTDTTVELGDGESFVISGLVDQDLAATVDKVPGLGDIPVLGAFFRSTSYDRQDRELIMVVTPHLVTPLKRGTDVPMPGEEYEDYDPGPTELFLHETGEFEPGSGGSTGFTR